MAGVRRFFEILDERLIANSLIEADWNYRPVDELALTRPPHFAHLEFDFVDCWERLGKELKVSKHR